MERNQLSQVEQKKKRNYLEDQSQFLSLLKKGETFQNKSLFKRPETGLHPKYLKKFLTKKLKNFLKKNTK